MLFSATKQSSSDASSVDFSVTWFMVVCRSRSYVAHGSHASPVAGLQSIQRAFFTVLASCVSATVAACRQL